MKVQFVVERVCHKWDSTLQSGIWLVEPRPDNDPMVDQFPTRSHGRTGLPFIACPSHPLRSLNPCPCLRSPADVADHLILVVIIAQRVRWQECWAPRIFAGERSRSGLPGGKGSGHKRSNQEK